MAKIIDKILYIIVVDIDTLYTVLLKHPKPLRPSDGLSQKDCTPQVGRGRDYHYTTGGSIRPEVPIFRLSGHGEVVLKE